MKNMVSAIAVVQAAPENVWQYVSEFSDASHQVIAVETTKKITDDKRTVIFKNGHQVDEHLLEKLPNKKIHWAQTSKKGFVPIKNTEVEITLSPSGNETELSFSFIYETVMGPVGWIMNMMMIKKKLKGIAEKNIGKIQKHFS